MLGCYGDSGVEATAYLCVGLLLLLLADQSLQRLHRVWTHQEVRGQLLLEALHPHRQLRSRRRREQVVLVHSLIAFLNLNV